MKPVVFALSRNYLGSELPWKIVLYSRLGLICAKYVIGHVELF